MKKLGILFVITLLLLVLMPGLAMAGGGVPAGSTLQSWIVSPNQGGKDTGIDVYYSGGFSTELEIDTPYNSSWHKLNDTRPILEAYKEGYGSNLGGIGGILGTNISFAQNVLAAMKVQNFNPAQVGGADIPPSSTTLSSDQTAWLEKMGYSVQSSSQPTAAPVQTQASTPTQTVQPQAQQTQTSTSSSTSGPQTTSSSSSASSKTGQTVTQPTSNPAAGETVKTPSGPMTQEMVSADQQLAVQNPPSLNPANIPTKLPVKEETTQQRNIRLWAVVGAVILALGAAAGRIIYVKHRAA